MLKLLRNMGVAAERDDNGTVRIDAAHAAHARGALRAGQDHARVGAGAGPAAGALRRGQGVAAGRLRHRLAPGRPAHQGPAGDGRRDRGRARLHGRQPAQAAATRLHGARITTDMVTVTGTENFLMAAALAEGETVLENAAQEPEITDLAEMLIEMGAKIEGHGTSRIRIQGVEKLHGCTHQVVADRIEAGTFLCAVAATGGDVRAAARPRRPPGRGDREAARGRRRRWTRWTSGIRVQRQRPPEGAELPHHRVPGLPDRHAGPVHGAQRASPKAPSKVTETIFENRFMHVNETGAPGRQDPDRRQGGGDRGRASSCRAPP